MMLSFYVVIGIGGDGSLSLPNHKERFVKSIRVLPYYYGVEWAAVLTHKGASSDDNIGSCNLYSPEIKPDGIHCQDLTMLFHNSSAAAIGLNIYVQLSETMRGKYVV